MSTEQLLNEMRHNLGILMRQSMFFPTTAEVSSILKEPTKIGRIKIIRQLSGRPPITKEEIAAVETVRRYGYEVTKATTHFCSLTDAKYLCEYFSAVAAFNEGDFHNFVRAIGGYSG